MWHQGQETAQLAKQSAFAVGAAAGHAVNAAEVAATAGRHGILQAAAHLQMATEAILNSDTFCLRDAGDAPVFAEDLRRIIAFLEGASAQGRQLPRTAVFVLVFLAFRLLSSCNQLCDAVVRQLVSSRTVLSRSCLLAATAPGWFLAFHFRNVLLEDVSDWRYGGGALVRNLRRMPPAFWLSIATSGAVSLQASSNFAAGATGFVLSLRLRSFLLLSALSAAAAARGQAGTVASIKALAEASAPALTEAARRLWHQLLARSRLTGHL